MCAEKADVSIYVLISVVYYDVVVAEETNSLSVLSFLFVFLLSHLLVFLP